MHKLERLILESYGQLLTEMDGGRLFDYFNNKGYDITERSSDGGNPGFEGYMVSKGEGRSPQAVIFQHNKDTDEFTISRMSGYRIDQDKAIKAGMREKSSSAVAGIDGYMTDGNYTPVNIDAEDLKDIVDHVMTGIDREAEAQRDYYAKRGPVSGIGSMDEERQLVHVYDKDGSIYGTGEVVGVEKDKTIVRFDGHTVKRFPDERVKPVMEKITEEIPDGNKRDVTNINKLPANYKKKLIDRYGEPFMDGKYDFISSDMDTYFKAYDRNEETGSTSHKIVKLPSFFKLYQDMVDIIEDIKTLMRSPEIRKDEAARELFELLKSNYRQLQKYLRTERPEQYDLMKMRRATYEAVRKLQEMYPVAGNDAKERFKTNHDAYKKANLKESLLDELNEQEPEPEEPADEKAPEETILEDATDQILSKFPTLKANIIKLQTEDFKEFVDTIDWISPRPTTFRVNLKNGQDYILKWTGTGFEAQIMGKRYYLNKIEDYQNALDKLNILYKEGPMSGAGEGEPADTDTGGTGGGGGGDFPGDDAAGGGGDFGGGDDEGGGDEFGGGGADLGDEPIDFEEPGEEPEA